MNSTSKAQQPQPYPRPPNQPFRSQHYFPSYHHQQKFEDQVMLAPEPELYLYLDLFPSLFRVLGLLEGVQLHP